MGPLIFGRREEMMKRRDEQLILDLYWLWNEQESRQ
jgi:hypothetical protein